jgi:hypothetical protein
VKNAAKSPAPADYFSGAGASPMVIRCSAAKRRRRDMVGFLLCAPR